MYNTSTPMPSPSILGEVGAACGRGAEGGRRPPESSLTSGVLGRDAGVPIWGRKGIVIVRKDLKWNFIYITTRICNKGIAAVEIALIANNQHGLIQDFQCL